MTTDPTTAHPTDLASLVLSLRPREPCPFRQSTARSLHAALLRRLELTDPALSASMHDAPAGAHTVVRPWTVSLLAGDFDQVDGLPVARTDRTYTVRLSALSATVAQALDHLVASVAAFPLTLERVPFERADPPVGVEPAIRTDYAAQLAGATPIPFLTLAWLTPTTCRQGTGHAELPTPRQCLEGYLRRWNAFAAADLALAAEPLLTYADRQVHLADAAVRDAATWLGGFAVRGKVGTVTWRLDPEPAVLARQAVALAGYAAFCGTGIKTAMGMGQTRLVSSPNSASSREVQRNQPRGGDTP